MRKRHYLLPVANAAALPWTMGWASSIAEVAGKLESTTSWMYSLGMIHLNLLAWPIVAALSFDTWRSKRRPPP